MLGSRLIPLALGIQHLPGDLCRSQQSPDVKESGFWNPANIRLWNPKSGAWNSKSRAWNLESIVWNPESTDFDGIHDMFRWNPRVWNPESTTQDPRSTIRDPEFTGWDLE